MKLLKLVFAGVLILLIFTQFLYYWKSHKDKHSKSQSWHARPSIVEGVFPFADNSTRENSKLATQHMGVASNVIRKSFMFSIHYAEQLTMSTSHYIQFLNLVVDWNFTGVEPFVLMSRMFGLQSMHKVSYNFGMLFNISSFNIKLSSCLVQKHLGLGNPILFESMDNFIGCSHRSIVTVYFSKHMYVLPRDLHKRMDRALKYKKGELVTDCTQLSVSIGMSPKIEELIKNEVDYQFNIISSDSPFKVIQAFCVRHDGDLSLLDLRESILSRIATRNVSIVFVSWQGQFTRSFSDLYRMNTCRLPATAIKYSDKVLTVSKHFIESLHLHKMNFVSVHIRFEKLFEYGNGQYKNKAKQAEQFYSCCMKRLNILLHKVKQQYQIPQNGTLIMNDYGSHGSDSCHYMGKWENLSVCKHQAQIYLSQINATSPSFNPLDHDSPDNSGFSSLVDANSLLMGKALITIGGGSYQSSIIARFNERSKQKWNEIHKNNATSKNNFVLPHYHICEQNELLNGIVLPEESKC